MLKQLLDLVPGRGAKCTYCGSKNTQLSQEKQGKTRTGRQIEKRVCNACGEWFVVHLLPDRIKDAE